MIAQELEVSLHMAFVEARQQRHEFITVEHLLLALLDNPSAAEVLRSTVDARSRYQPDAQANEAEARIVVPGDAAASVLLRRMRSRDPRVQMPPLGTEHADEQALALLSRWIRQELPRHKEP